MTDGTVIKSKQTVERPTLSFEEITFSDGSTFSFEADDIIVFVGPNNAGKSAALRELEVMVAKDQSGQIIKKSKIRRSGDSAMLRAYLEQNSQKIGQQNEPQYSGIGFNIHHSHLLYFDQPHDRHPVAPFFAKRLATESRISDSNGAQGIALFQDAPSHPIHMLLMDDELTADISSKFKHAFGVDLIPFRAGGSRYPLYVGAKPVLPPGKDELSKLFVDQLRNNAVNLDSQGDGMRSFASVLLHIVASSNHSIQFLDEPEAFLHPPQARLLGKYIAEGRRGESQLFIATHSTDILNGLIEGGSNKVRIIRIRRSASINHVKELNKAQTKAIANDTLTRFSRVFDGIFFEHVVVCESDADCMFYQSILNLPSISGDRRPDVLFIHASGKHRMAKLVRTLKALDVPTSVIADIDVISEENTFKGLVTELGGDWADIGTHWRSVRNTVISQRPPLNATQVKDLIAGELSAVSGTNDFPQDKEKAIKNIFRAVSPFSALKQSGRRGLPNGEPTIQYDTMAEKCTAIGLWIVPVGEVEGFCKSLGSHGPGFVERVLETKDLEKDAELSEAREFIMKIWNQARLKK